MVIGILRSKLLVPLLVIVVALFGWVLHGKSKGGSSWMDEIMPDEPTKNIQPTITEDVAISIANGLQRSMENLGTRNYDLWRLIKDLNPRDWKMVNLAFGRRHYHEFTGMGHPMFSEKPLIVWLKNEISPRKKEDKKIYEQVRDLYYANRMVF